MNCPNCGTPNRPNARFCARCRQPLPGQPAALPLSGRVCPRCGHQNRPAAHFCARCAYTFSGPTSLPAPSSARPTSRVSLPWLYLAAITAGMLLLVGLVAAGLLIRAQMPGLPIAAVPTSTLQPPTPIPQIPISNPQSPPPDPLTRALLATVQVIAPVDGGGPASTGSGSILTRAGHILTNFHVIGQPETGQLFNRQDLILVAVSPPDLKGPPEILYQAQLVQGDPALDLALLKIIARRDGSSLPPDLGLATIPVGDSDTLTIGAELSISGFPGLGGETVTLTRGLVAGFLPAEGWIKTDAEINPGNSGGAAIDHVGELIGVPTQVTLEETSLPGKIGLVRPINLARPLIELALSQAGEK